MSFEEIKNFSLLCVFIWVTYELIWKSKDQGKGRLSAFSGAGIAVILLFFFAIIRFVMGLCGHASLEDFLLLRARNMGFCGSPLELSYTIIAAIVLAALWNGITTLWRLLRSN